MDTHYSIQSKIVVSVIHQCYPPAKADAACATKAILYMFLSSLEIILSIQSPKMLPAHVQFYWVSQIDDALWCVDVLFQYNNASHVWRSFNHWITVKMNFAEKSCHQKGLTRFMPTILRILCKAIKGSSNITFYAALDNIKN